MTLEDRRDFLIDESARGTIRTLTCESRCITIRGDDIRRIHRTSSPVSRHAAVEVCLRCGSSL
jgi:hypothetical protein